MPAISDDNDVYLKNIYGFILFHISEFIVIFLGLFFPRGEGAMRLTLFEAATRE